MRRNILLQVGLVAAIAAGLRVDAADGLRLAGAGPADAKDYYTKKRVNGRWINGRFPKRSAARTSSPEQDTSGSPRAPASRTATVSARAAAAGASTSPTSLAAPVAAGAAATAAGSDGERLDKLRQALQARANALTTGSVAPPEAPRPGLEPHSVALDFQSGIKTTLFSDGTMVREPFDVPALKSLAAPPP
jgi:hypothetical protein